MFATRLKPHDKKPALPVSGHASDASSVRFCRSSTRPTPGATWRRPATDSTRRPQFAAVVDKTWDIRPHHGLGAIIPTPSSRCYYAARAVVVVMMSGSGALR